MEADEPTKASPPPIDYATPKPRRERLWMVALALAVAGAAIPLSGFAGALLGRVSIRRERDCGNAHRSHALAAVIIGLAFGSINSLLTIELLLHLANANEISGRVRCASQMRAFGSVMQLFVAEHRGAYPPDLSVILSDGYGAVPEVFICPRGDGLVAAANFTSDPTARAAKNLDYIYVGEGLTNKANADEPILFERLTDHDHDGGNVLFGDGHVEFITKPQILKLLEPLRGTSRLTDEEYDAIVAK